MSMTKISEHFGEWEIARYTRHIKLLRLLLRLTLPIPHYPLPKDKITHPASLTIELEQKLVKL